MRPGLGAAALAIRGYRRFLSGRGPLRRVACTFAATESCSAYGLRVVGEVATSLPGALGLIRARLHACRDSSLHRFGARGLGWGGDHEREPGELHAAMVARGERPDAIAQVLAARAAVARWRADHDAETACGAALGSRPRPRVPIRPGDAVIARHRRLGARDLIAAAGAWVLAVAIAIAVSIAVAVVVAAVALLLLRSGRRHRRAARRFERQRAAASFLRPRRSGRSSGVALVYVNSPSQAITT